MKNLESHLNLEPLEDRMLLATCHVNRLTDVGSGMGFRGDLRYCINKVNVEPGADAISFRVGGGVNLTAALPDLASYIDIQGPGADVVTVRRDTGGDYRIFTVAVNANVRISGLTIANGRSNQGGGIYNAGVLKIDGCAITSNVAYIIPAPGGAVQGGGIFNFRGGVELRNSTVSGNAARVEGPAFDTVFAEGGGIYNFFGALTIHNSTITENIAQATMTGHDRRRFGGGIHNVNMGVLVVVNSTIARNSTGSSGFSRYGGGVYNGVDSQTRMRNTILAENTAYVGPDLNGNLVSLGHNLIGSTSGGTGYAPTDILNVNPMLGSLADNGGPMTTLALLPGSPAIDAGDNANAPEFDQRGPGFARIVNGIIDIGAFEVQSTAAPSISRLSSTPGADTFSMFLATADLDSLTPTFSGGNDAFFVMEQAAESTSRGAPQN